MKSNIRDFISLTKLPISLLVAFSAIFGYFATSNLIDLGIIIPLFLGTFSFSAAASILNHLQDRKRDSFFIRTKLRPLPQKRIGIKAALIIFSLFFTLALLFFWNQSEMIFYGLASMLVYNGIYTPFKRISNLAILPGTLSGVLPITMGIVAAGGDPLSLNSWILYGILGLWQIPHFWLIQLRHPKDFGKMPAPHLYIPQIQRILPVWALLYAISTLFLASFGIITGKYLQSILLINFIAVTIHTIFRSLSKIKVSKLSFIHFNISLFVIFVLVISEALLIST